MQIGRLPSLICLVMPLVALDAFAQDRFPSRPIRLVVPYPPGGSAEVLPGFDCSSWYGLIGPAGMPKALVTRMNADLNRILANAEFGQRLMLGGVEAMSGTPDGMQRFIVSEQKRWSAVIRSAGITADVMR